jgi:hypothetical protein
VKELNADVGTERLLKVRQTECLEVTAADESSNVIQQEDSVNGREAFALIRNPVHQKVRDYGEQTVHEFRVGLESRQELGCAHQERGNIERTARYGESDLVPCLLNLRLQMLKPLNHEGHQSVFARIRFLQ